MSVNRQFALAAIVAVLFLVSDIAASPVLLMRVAQLMILAAMICQPIWDAYKGRIYHGDAWARMPTLVKTLFAISVLCLAGADLLRRPVFWPTILNDIGFMVGTVVFSIAGFRKVAVEARPIQRPLFASTEEAVHE